MSLEQKNKFIRGLLNKEINICDILGNNLIIPENNYFSISLIENEHYFKFPNLDINNTIFLEYKNKIFECFYNIDLFLLIKDFKIISKFNFENLLKTRVGLFSEKSPKEFLKEYDLAHHKNSVLYKNLNLEVLDINDYKIFKFGESLIFHYYNEKCFSKKISIFNTKSTKSFIVEMEIFDLKRIFNLLNFLETKEWEF